MYVYKILATVNENVYSSAMNSQELLRKLRKLGADIDRSHGKGSHARIILNGRATIMPMHRTELKTGTLHGILKQLGLRLEDLQ